MSPPVHKETTRTSCLVHSTSICTICFFSPSSPSFSSFSRFTRLPARRNKRTRNLQTIRFSLAKYRGSCKTVTCVRRYRLMYFLREGERTAWMHEPKVSPIIVVFILHSCTDSRGIISRGDSTLFPSRTTFANRSRLTLKSRRFNKFGLTQGRFMS